MTALFVHLFSKVFLLCAAQNPLLPAGTASPKVLRGLGFTWTDYPQKPNAKHTRCLGSFCMPPPELLPRLLRQLRQQGGVLRLQLSNAVDQRQLRAAAVQVHIACARMCRHMSATRDCRSSRKRQHCALHCHKNYINIGSSQ